MVVQALRRVIGDVLIDFVAVDGDAVKIAALDIAHEQQTARITAANAVAAERHAAGHARRGAEEVFVADARQRLQSDQRALRTAAILLFAAKAGLVGAA